MKSQTIHFWKYKEDADDGKVVYCELNESLNIVQPAERILCLRRLLNTEIQTPKGFSLRKNSFELYTGQLTQDEPDNHIAGVTLGTFLFSFESILIFYRL